MSLGLASFGSIDDVVTNPLIYPRRILIQVLESLFSQPALFDFAGAPQNPFLYVSENSDTARQSRLVIADSFSDELKKPDSRPTIIVSRGAFQFNNLAVGNKQDNFTHKKLVHISATAKGLGTDDRTRVPYMDLTTMGLSVTCYSRRDTEVDQLVWLVGGGIKIFRQMIRDGARIHKISTVSIGPVVPIKTDSQIELFSARVDLIVDQTITWVLQTTASPGNIAAGLNNLSGYNYPRTISQTSPYHITVLPVQVTESPALENRWLGNY